MLIFRDSNKSFKLDGDLSKTLTNCKFNVGQSNQQDGKVIREFAEQMKFDIKKIGQKSPRGSCIVELLKSPAIKASGISTKFLSSDPKELCDGLRLLLQEKQAGNKSNMNIKEIIAIVDNLFGYKCSSKEQQKQFLIKCNLLNSKEKK